MKDRVVILSVCLGTVQYWWISIGLVVVQLRAVFCPLVQYLSLFCHAFSWTILDSSRFPLFHSGKVFHQLVYPLTVVLPQIFFNLTTPFSYPVFFTFFMHLLMLLFTSMYCSDPSGYRYALMCGTLCVRAYMVCCVRKKGYLMCGRGEGGGTAATALDCIIAACTANVVRHFVSLQPALLTLYVILYPCGLHC